MGDDAASSTTRRFAEGVAVMLRRNHHGNPTIILIIAMIIAGLCTICTAEIIGAVQSAVSNTPEREWQETLIQTRAQDCTGMHSTRELFRQYPKIFKTGNRNAASHLWAGYLLERCTCVSKARFLTLSKGFCAVSGSPLDNVPRPRSCYQAQHKSVSGSMVIGQERHCCPPCFCDAQDWVAIDTKTVKFKDGSAKLNFMVIGNPCVKSDHPFSASLKKQAPELSCSGGKLAGATLSDSKHIIIGVFYVSSDEKDSDCHAQDTGFLKKMCVVRDKNPSGTGGMGSIFDDLAKINPVVKPGTRAVSGHTKKGKKKGKQ